MVTMGSGFQTTLQDLANAAESFRDGADQFSKALGDVTTLRVDSGDGGLNTSIQAILAAIGALHDRVVQDLRETGDNLDKVRADYQRSDVRLRELYDDIMRADPIDKS
jgi:ABC-type transporter Mla subunit MlaD